MPGKRLGVNRGGKGHARRIASGKQLYVLCRAGRLALLPLEEASNANRIWSDDADIAIREGVADDPQVAQDDPSVRGQIKRRKRREDASDE